MTHTLKFDASVKRDAQNALKLMMTLFEANWSAVSDVYAPHVVQWVDSEHQPLMEIGPATPQSLASGSTIAHHFEYIAGDCCMDPFSAIATFIAKLARYASTKKLGSELAYRHRAEIRMETSFECGHEWYEVKARLVLVGEDNLPGCAND